MKFFSNETKENPDEPEYGRDQRGDVVTSEPVAVPQQRAGSPWSDAPGSSETAPQADDSSAASPSTGTSSSPADTSSREGLSSPADTSSPDGLSSPDDTDGRATDADAEPGSPDDELAEQERRDGTHDTVTTYGPDGTVTERSADDDVDLSLDSDSDRAAVKDEGTFDSPRAVDPATGSPLDADSATRADTADAAPDDTLAAARADAADTDDSAVTRADASDTDDSAVERADAEAEARETVDEERADERKAEIDGEPVAIVPEPVPVAAASTPGGAPAPALDRLFSDSDSFAERFREIQLRFVDSPKEATADAAALVGEAVDKLTDALRAQKDALGGDSDDTEQLRVQLRSYRDLLNRLSAL